MCGIKEADCFSYVRLGGIWCSWVSSVSLQPAGHAVPCEDPLLIVSYFECQGYRVYHLLDVLVSEEMLPRKGGSITGCLRRSKKQKCCHGLARVNEDIDSEKEDFRKRRKQ